MNDRETLTTDLNVFADFDPKLPDAYKSAPYLLLGNIQPALQRAVKAQMNGSLRLVGGDTMNYWIADFREELLETIAEWDFLLINDSEARMLSGENNLERPRPKFSRWGRSTLVIKRGEHGAILWHGDRHFMVPGYLLEDVFDPTGAGDCFAGGFMGYLAGEGVDLRRQADVDPTAAAPRGNLRLGDGQFLLRAFRRGPVPHADPRGDRWPLRRVQGVHGFLGRSLHHTLPACRRGRHGGGRP